MRRAAGFTLIEAVIVVGLLAAALTITLSAMSMRSRAQQADRLVHQAAVEMAMVARATTSYFTAERVAALAPNVRGQLQLSTLISEGLLPANFAHRGGTIGTSVFGQPYMVIYLQIPATASLPALASFVVTEEGVPQPTPLARAGVANTEDAILTLKQRVATKVSEDHAFPSGFISRNTRIVRGGFRGFTKDLTAYLTAQPTQALAVVLGNFADLSPTSITTPPNPFATGGYCQVVNGVRNSCANNFNQQVDCAWSSNVTQYRGPSIPTNATSVFKIPICDPAQLRILSPGVPGVALTYNRHEVRTEGVQYTVTPACNGGIASPPENDGYSISVYQQVKLNDGIVFSEICYNEQTIFDPSICSRRQAVYRQAGERVLQTSGNISCPPGTCNPLTGPSQAERGHVFFCTPS